MDAMGLCQILNWRTVYSMLQGKFQWQMTKLRHSTGEMWCGDVGVWRMWSIELMLWLLWPNQSSRDVNVAIMVLTTSLVPPRPPPPTICLWPGSIIWMVITCLTPSPGLQPATFREARVNADSLCTLNYLMKGRLVPTWALRLFSNDFIFHNNI